MVVKNNVNSSQQLPCLEAKAQLARTGAALPSQEEQTKNKGHQGASCQSANPRGKDDTSTWHWVVHASSAPSTGEQPCGSPSQQLPGRSPQINP